MIKTRILDPKDLDLVRAIWEKYYQNEFEFPEFFRHFLAAFVVESKGEIVVTGGVRLIPEVIIMTDKSFSSSVKKRALEETLRATSYITMQSGHNEMHAFIHDSTWEKHLKKYGFQDTSGKSLVKGL